MTTNDLKSSISTALQAFASTPLRKAAIELFAKLGYSSERTLATGSVADFCVQFDSKNRLDHPSAMKAQWQSVELLFQLTDEELSSTASLFRDTTVSSGLVRSYVFFAIELKPSSNANDYARGKLAAITRQINRLFPMPVMVLFKVPSQQGDKLSLAVINRRTHKRDDSRDVMGKVTLIQNISIAQPHRGHLDILASFSVPELQSRKTPIANFDELHAAWETVFNVELLNKRFYEELSNWYFWARKQVSFPDDLEKDTDKRNATSVIRLLTRLIFCWFLKEKDLIPDRLFDVDELKEALTKFDALDDKDSTYYRAILQNLFFATLNQEMSAEGKASPRQFVTNDGFLSNRTHHGIKTLYRYQESFHSTEQALALFEGVPFLNGGLFACLDVDGDDGKVLYADGFTRTKNKQASVPNHLFFAASHEVDLSGQQDYGDAKKKKAKVRGLIHILQAYKFTIAESTPVEQEIALDPELLGNVFENLLASYNPETGESARKQTGSFYTPRPIVDYMVDESLKAYLASALQQAIPKTTELDAKTGLDILFAYTEREHPFTPAETKALITAIDQCNILDPACGSGAYPMGILHKLVFILAKLDTANQEWKQRQIDGVLGIPDTTVRDDMLMRIESDFADNNLDFGRKLYLIEKCIYGVDIQPIAIQISKLRFFISLVCDQRIYPDRPNLGVRPLPNLEIKFVAANTLIALKLPSDRSFYDSPEVQALEKELETVRHLYFSAKRREDKKRLKTRDEALVQGIVAQLEASGFAGADIIRRARWSPYDAISAADFFDPGTMFGPHLKQGFDVVIGNPPYVQIQKFPAAQKQAWVAQNFKTYGATADIYCLFFERGVQLLKEGGHLSYITSNRWMRAGYGEALRSWMASQVNTSAVLDFGMGQNFGAATTYTSIVHLSKETSKNQVQACYAEDTKAAMDDPANYFAQNASHLASASKEPWVVLPPTRQRIKQYVEAQGKPLDEWAIKINFGIKTGYNEAFYLNDQQRAALIAADPKSEQLIVPLLRGRGLHRYGTDWYSLGENEEKWMLNTHNGVKGTNVPAVNVKRDYPAVWKHLKTHEAMLDKRQDHGDHWSNLRNCAYMGDFSKPKIFYPNITKDLPFYFDTDDHFYGNDLTWIISSVSENLAALTAQLNSILFRFCFKGNFPELLGGAAKTSKIFFDKIPLKRPSPEQAQVLEVLVGWVQTGKRYDVPAFKTAFVESLIDACVLEMYFEDEMLRCNLSFMARIEDLLDTIKTLEAFYDVANDSKHPLRNGLLRLPVESPELFGLVLREGKT